MPELRICALYPDLMNIYADRGNLQQLQVAAVGVDVHQVGIERADAQLSHGRPPPRSRRARRVSGMWRSSSASRPCAAASSASSPGVDRSARCTASSVVVRSPSGAISWRMRSIAHAAVVDAGSRPAGR